jgi:CheY-like chemotaxis protein
MLPFEPTIRKSRIKVAYADDDPVLRRVTSRLLSELGYEVVYVAEDGAELIKYCEQGPIDVALVDLDMPCLDGLAVAQELAPKGIPVILISGHPDADHVVIEAEPVFACLPKPTSLDVLQKTIDDAAACLPPH